MTSADIVQSQRKLGQQSGISGELRLEKYQPLTAERLEELEINAIKIFKVEGSDDVHLEFIWDENLN